MLSTLETRTKNHPALWPHATRAHRPSSAIRAEEARKCLSNPNPPFVLPGQLHAMQVEVHAGEQVLGALHVEWMRKLADFTLEALVLDCQHSDLGLDHSLDVLPEKAFYQGLPKI